MWAQWITAWQKGPHRLRNFCRWCSLGSGYINYFPPRIPPSTVQAMFCRDVSWVGNRVSKLNHGYDIERVESFEGSSGSSGVALKPTKLSYKGASKPLRKPSKRYFKGLRSLRRRFPIPSGLRSSLKVPLKAWKVPYKGDMGASKVYSLAQRWNASMLKY